MRRRFTNRVVILAAAVAAVFTAAGAYAYFHSTGSGHANASVGTVAPVTISAGSVPATKVFPGGSGDVTISIHNPNSTTVFVGHLSLDTTAGTGNSGFSGPSGCDPPPLSFPSYAFNQYVSPGDTPFTLIGAVSMATTAANACQGATFTVYLTAGP
jgi:hypothetical protein